MSEQPLYTLIIRIDGDHDDLYYENLVSGVYEIGRHPACEIIAPAEDVSRKHCRLTISQEGDIWIIDHGSRNGTRVNGAKLPAGYERQLNSKQRIRIGNQTLLTFVSPDTTKPSIA